MADTATLLPLFMIQSLGLQLDSLSGADLVIGEGSSGMVIMVEAKRANAVSMAPPPSLLQPIGSTTTPPGLEAAFSLLPSFMTLSLEAAIAISSRWAGPCEAVFDYLAENFPEDLIQIIKTGTLDAAELTLAAESLGNMKSSERVRSVLVQLLQDDNALVREGAIYGLRGHEDESTLAILRDIAEHDPNPDIRQVAADTPPSAQSD